MTLYLQSVCKIREFKENRGKLVLLKISVNSRENERTIREVAYLCFFNKSISKYTEEITRKQILQSIVGFSYHVEIEVCFFVQIG